MPIFSSFRDLFCSVLSCLCDCLPERLTNTLTLLEIFYYCIAIVYFFVELVVLCLSLK